LKLIYQRASMKYYESYLLDKKCKVEYLNWKKNPNFWWKHILKTYGKNNNIYIIDPIDILLENRVKKFGKYYGQQIIWLETPSFLSTNLDLENYVSGLKIKQQKFYQYNFYIWQRHKLNILFDKSKPLGGKFSYDKNNRKPIPGKDFVKFVKDNKIKFPQRKYNNIFYAEAIIYCENTFPNHYLENYFPENIYFYPITHSDIKFHFKIFLKYKLKYFGNYEDAIDFNHPYLFHSVISPQLNNGLLIPKWILFKILQFFSRSHIKKLILPAVEGFIRQLNWREYSRLLYRYAYHDMKKNYFNNHRHLNQKWYTGTTGIIPVDLAIKQAFQYGYLHHIIRLMIMCNFMNLCRIDPNDVYTWFMEFSLDSYDWVMINNVYSMGMYADGGLTTTKLYISSSNYILSESNIKPDKYWNIVWTTLYYYFIYKNYSKLKGRSKIYQNQWNKYSNKLIIKKQASKIIKNLTDN
jgi:deoxyribodipyrimidine photolyase-related protein